MLAITRYDQEFFSVTDPQTVLEAMERAVARAEVIAIRAKAIKQAAQEDENKFARRGMGT